MWYYFKEPIVNFFGMSRDALHVHVGLTLFLLSIFLLYRNPRKILYAWLVVLAAQTINELLDFHDWYYWTKSWNWHKSVSDSIHTLLWPSILFALLSCRLRK
jgi:hypothetical protein